MTDTLISVMNGNFKRDEEKNFRTPIEIALDIDSEGMTTASKLYAFLELSPSNYSKWCKSNITENEFATENEDFTRFVIEYESGVGTKQREDYRLTAHFAKKLSMKGNGEKAEQAREYFTRLEEKVKQKAIDLSQLSPELQLFKQMFDTIATQQLEQKRQAAELSKINDNVKELQAKIETHNEDYYTVAGYASLRGIKVDISKANMFGRKCSKLSKNYGYDVGKTKDPRFGTVNTYHVDISKEVFKEVA